MHKMRTNACIGDGVVNHQNFVRNFTNHGIIYQRERQTDRQRNRDRGRETDTEIERQTDRDTERDRE